MMRRPLVCSPSSLLAFAFALACGSSRAGFDGTPGGDGGAAGTSGTSSSGAGGGLGSAANTGDGSTAGAVAGAGAAGQGSGGQSNGTGPEPNNNPAAYPDSIRCLQTGDARCGAGFRAEAALTEPALAEALSRGYAAWTDPESEGGPCVSCHSPDGIDLAWIGYSDCDLRRRALDHVAPDQAEAIVQYVHALRQQYAIDKPLHPDKYRPLQPGYVPFGDPADDIEVADTDLQDQRDEAFMLHLTDELELIWATRTIDSLQLAHEAYAELDGLDLKRLPLGIPFDRFSEDPNASDNECSSEGSAHRGRSIFEWVPAMPMRPRAGSETQWLALLEDYRQQPTTVNLWRYYDAIDELLECRYDLTEGDLSEYTRACEWMRFKYKSLQVLQHMLRHQTLDHPDQLADVRVQNPSLSRTSHLETIIHRSPIWETADLIRIAPLERRDDPACFSSDAHPCTFLPPDIDQTVHSVPTHQEALIQQNDLFQISWFVMSFLDDPSLTTHSDNFATYVGDYLESVLLPRYDIHHAFIVALMAVKKASAHEWLEYPGFREGTGKIASVRTFSFKQLRNNFSEPASEPRRAVHRRMFANFARMWIYLVEEDLRQSGEIYGRSGEWDGSPSEHGGVLQAIRFMREWIGELEGQQDPAINQIVLSIEQLAAEAVELRGPANYEQVDGLQPTGTWGDLQAPYEE